MKRRILSLLAAAALLAAPLSPAARAGEDVLFPVVRAYEEQFSDVSADDWYYESVKALYELGLANGRGGGSRFDPQGDVTVAEAVTMAARLRSLYEYGDSEAGPGMFGPGGAWYLPYAAYLQERGAIGQEFADSWEDSATRAQMAHILANALPGSLFEPINGEAVAAACASGAYIRDVDGETPYRQDILRLYEWGILSGMDRTGSFQPEERIPRCQVAAMVVRLARGEQRIRLDWDSAPAYSRAGTAMQDLVYSDGAFYSAPSPDGLQEIDADVRYMLSRGERQLSLSYPPDSMTREDVRSLMNAFLNVVRGYVEQTYNEVECSYSLRSGMVTFVFSSSLYGDDMIGYYREATMDYAIAVHDRLWEEGTVTPNMTEYDKARAYFTWICENCAYDFDGINTDGSMSHSGYRAFAEGVAVCDGYTAAYNLLLKLEGISCTTYSAGDHIWTVAELDGTPYHIDTTWGDQTGTIAYRFFAMTEADSLARFG